MTLEPTFSEGWFEIFAKPDDEVTAREVAFLLSADKTARNGVLVLDVFDPPWFGAHQGPHTIERHGHLVEEHKRVTGQLYEPSELIALGEKAGLACESSCAGFDTGSSPCGEVARMQMVFRRL